MERLKSACHGASSEEHLEVRKRTTTLKNDLSSPGSVVVLTNGLVSDHCIHV